MPAQFFHVFSNNNVNTIMKYYFMRPTYSLAVIWIKFKFIILFKLLLILHLIVNYGFSF